MPELSLKKKGGACEEVEIFIFSSGEIHFGVDLSEVKEIIDIPEERDNLIKMEALIPTLDLSSLIGLTGEGSAKGRRIISIIDQNPYSFIVDEIIGVVSLDEGKVLPFPELVKANFESKSLLGLFLQEERLVFLLSLAYLIKDRGPADRD
jgi:chemotaxis signal transduction protein